jgi:hypothetical protein
VNHLPPRAFKAPKIPKVRKKPRRTSAIKCRAHLNWVKNPEIWQCVAAGSGECFGPLDPHHVVSRGAGGGDEQVVTLCRRHHDICHDLKTKAFDERYGTDIAATAAELWQLSPAGREYRLKQQRASSAPLANQSTTPFSGEDQNNGEP